MSLYSALTRLKIEAMKQHRSRHHCRLAEISLIWPPTVSRCEIIYEMKWKVQWFKVRSKTDLEPAQSNTPCKQVQPLSRIKTLNGPRVHGISPVEKEKVYEGNDKFFHLPSLSPAVKFKRLLKTSLFVLDHGAPVTFCFWCTVYIPICLLSLLTYSISSIRSFFTFFTFRAYNRTIEKCCRPQTIWKACLCLTQWSSHSTALASHFFLDLRTSWSHQRWTITTCPRLYNAVFIVTKS